MVIGRPCWWFLSKARDVARCRGDNTESSFFLLSFVVEEHLYSCLPSNQVVQFLSRSIDNVSDTRFLYSYSFPPASCSCSFPSELHPLLFRGTYPHFIANPFFVTRTCFCLLCFTIFPGLHFFSAFSPGGGGYLPFLVFSSLSCRFRLSAVHRFLGCTPP